MNVELKPSSKDNVNNPSRPIIEKANEPIRTQRRNVQPMPRRNAEKLATGDERWQTCDREKRA